MRLRPLLRLLRHQLFQTRLAHRLRHLPLVRLPHPRLQQQLRDNRQHRRRPRHLRLPRPRQRPTWHLPRHHPLRQARLLRRHLLRDSVDPR